MGASNSKLVQHPVVPYGLAWGESVCAAGSDCKVCARASRLAAPVRRTELSNVRHCSFTVMFFGESLRWAGRNFPAGGLEIYIHNCFVS